MESITRRIARWGELIAPIARYALESSYARLVSKPGVHDFAFGNPHDMPVPGLAEALSRASVPQHKDWFAYKHSEPEAQAVIAASLRQHRGLPFEPEDVALTNGAFAALAVSLTAILEPGDEAIFNSPPWFFYEGQIAAAGGVPVRVRVNPHDFDLDLDAIGAAITARTRAIIVNSPNNPTGKVYPPQTLEALSRLLEAASQRNGRVIYLLSDEAYSRIVFDGRACPSPTAFYPNTLLLYTYGKTLLAPGERIGYVALPPTMPDREALRQAIFVAQLLTGYAFPNATLQYALPDLETLSIDVGRIQARRDRMVAALREIGYALHVPDGTFYLLVRSPDPDDWAFTERLAEHDILCMPGTVLEMPGSFRISLTANEEMIEGALPGFARALQGTVRAR